MSSAQHPPGPPYPPKVAALGGLPSVIPDIPACAALMVVYIAFAAANMTIFQINRRRHYKFLPTVFTFGFCMARIVTLALRIAWAKHQHNVRLAIAASVFVNAGVLIIYILNLIYAQRILRALQPKLGWHRAISVTLKVFYASIGAVLAMVITAVIISSYSLNMKVLKAARDIQLSAITYLLVFDTLPLVLLALAHFLPTSSEQETFGQGSLLKKKLVVFIVGCLAVLQAGFKAGIAWMPPKPVTHPPWYDSKACFYVFGFVLEILMLLTLTASRPDRLFYVPDGSKGPGDYTRLRIAAGSTDDSVRDSIEDQEKAILRKP